MASFFLLFFEAWMSSAVGIWTKFLFQCSYNYKFLIWIPLNLKKIIFLEWVAEERQKCFFFLFLSLFIFFLLLIFNIIFLIFFFVTSLLEKLSKFLFFFFFFFFFQILVIWWHSIWMTVCVNEFYFFLFHVFFFFLKYRFLKRRIQWEGCCL